MSPQLLHINSCRSFLLLLIVGCGGEQGRRQPAAAAGQMYQQPNMARQGSRYVFN
jgi:hypothetical protein